MQKILIISFCTLLFASFLNADVNFQYEFSLYKPDASDNLCNVELFDYNDDGIEEIFIGYSNENIMKIVCYDLSGDTIITFNDTLASDAEFQKFTIVNDCDIHILVTVSNFSSSQNNKKFMIKLYNLYNMFLIDSLIYQVPYPSYDGNNPLDIKTIVTTMFNTKLLIFVGYIYTFYEYYGVAGMDYYIISYITKISYENNLLHEENIERCGLSLIPINDSLLISLGSYYYCDFGEEWTWSTRQLYLKSLTNEMVSNVCTIYNIWGQYNDGIAFHWPAELKIISNNNLNMEDFGSILYYKSYDSATDYTISYMNYNCDFTEILWEKNDTQIGYDNINSRSCCEVYNQDKYVIYFREGKLEIRNRENGNIFYYQNSILDPNRILRLSDGNLLILEERQDETGYDVYTFAGPFFGIDQDDHAIDDQRAINFPNPFHSSTTFSFSSKEQIQNAEIKIYNIKGQLVQELRFNASSLSRFHEVTWDGLDKNGQKVSPGVYLYQLLINGEQKTERKCLLIE